MMCKETDLVQLPYDEKGLIMEWKDQLWAPTCLVLIVESPGIFNTVGEVINFLQRDVALIPMKK